ncbi:hypothetical protein MF672_006525 [Actinomadura sp. ATCC 31491]|uniref:PqqD family peptide modification chaperone n=1 Tax=Actinomadura luzonensis TaxID=2805427 RepID=A0ABT0FMI6_9ACTN|nr:hypothetical protein [Actinomadura luzonensis]MCK2213449.1 hypothetical protein [Actinomadura luzonensis]
MTVAFHRLAFRQDGDEWIVGRVDSGDFVAVPEEGVLAIRLLQDGLDVEQVRARLLHETGADLDVADFVGDLAEAGLVAGIGGRPVPSPPPLRPTLPRLRPRHLRWALHPALHLALLVPIGAGAGCLALRPEIFPGWRAAFFTGHGAAVLLTWAAIAWLTTGLHELAHLVTARAAGVPARITLGTRLQFLVAQTDVSGVWPAPRRVRVTVYLSGIAVDLALCGAALTWTFFAGPGPVATWLTLVLTLRLAAQLLVFTRTDLYFLLQDATGCRDLYGDGAAYVRDLLSFRRRTRLATLPPRERRAVRLYAAVQGAGTLACLAFAALVTLPLVVTLLARSIQSLLHAADPAAVAEAIVVLALVLVPDVLWARAWWGRHGPRVRRWTALARAALPRLARPFRSVRR